jgi:predicted dehydrogenase
MSGLELALLCSSNPESKNLVSPSCRITSDWREVATSGEIDGVIVATPPALHARMVEEALRSGLPVMVEKPLTLDHGEARRLGEIAGEADAPVLVDHIYLFHPAYRALKREAADMGAVRRILSVGGNRGPFRKDASALWDYGPHDLALCLDLLGASPARISAERVASQSTEEGYGEVVSLSLEFAGGVRAEISAGNLMDEKRRRFAVWLEKGALVFDDLAEHPLMRYETGGDSSGGGALGGPGGVGHPIPASPTLPLTAALEAFASGIRGEAGEEFGLALGVEIVRLLGECEAQLPPRGGVS